MFEKVIVVNTENKTELPIISEDQYYEMLKTQDICYLSDNEERLYQDTEDYFEDAYVETDEDIYWAVDRAKRVKVYEKDRFHLRPDWVKEKIAHRAYDDYFMEDSDQVAGWELVDKFCEEFNKKQSWYTSGKQIAWLDLSKEMKEYFISYNDLTEEKWQTLEKIYGD